MSDEIKCSATISPCGKYRYYLSRVWDIGEEYLVWVMLNPSTADASTNDPTVRRCMALSRVHGYGGAVVVNLFAFRATNPKSLLKEVYLEGRSNDAYIEGTVRGRDCVVAWGSHGDKYEVRVKAVLNIVRANAASIYCLGRTKTGQPYHPLVRRKAGWEEFV